jgi:hypothetical protein
VQRKASEEEEEEEEKLEASCNLFTKKLEEAFKTLLETTTYKNP